MTRACIFRWGIGALIGLLIVGVLAAPAISGPRVQVYHDPAPSDEWYARLEVLNISGVYNETETLETAHGPVAVEYQTTLPNKVNDPASADSACVVSLPDGVVAVPMCLQVMEKTTGTIFLFPFIGG